MFALDGRSKVENRRLDPRSDVKNSLATIVHSSLTLTTGGWNATIPAGLIPSHCSIEGSQNMILHDKGGGAKDFVQQGYWGQTKSFFFLQRVVSLSLYNFKSY